ncbi:MAG: hypothetical protein GQ531_01000 [Sulfurovum sp.]|nr:hypothetical protein [Sulfurovum sp.]
MRYYLFLLSAFLFLGCGPGDHMDDDSMDTSLSMETSTEETTTLYYGNVNDDTVVLLDIEKMQVQEVINSNGVNPYEISQGIGDDLYVMNRSDYTIGILDTKTNTIDNEIALSFYPRSISTHLSDMLLTSANEPAAAVITSNTASQTYTDSAYVAPVSFGGSNATGHPVWVDDNYFLLLDRTENSIELYEKNTYAPVYKLTTQSSVHHVMYKDGYYYGISEGEQNGVSPGVIKFSVANGKITVAIDRLFTDLANLPSDFIPASWGAHHGAFHPTSDYIYVGSTEGNVFVLDLATLTLVDTFKAGKGVGHFTFYNNMVITTNHYDTFKSFHDASDPTSNKFIKNLYFSDKIYAGVTMQSHTTHILDGKLYFMFNTDQRSTLYKVNLGNITIEESLTLVNAYCLMGSLSEGTGGM